MKSTFTAGQTKNVKAALADLKAHRESRNLNQQTFWPSYGVTQSGGSRYEAGRGIDKPLTALMALHIAGKITDDDLASALAFANGTAAGG